MVKVCVEYQGELRSEVLHDPSGSTFTTDAPVDNQGKGEGFSPTDLCAAALGSCLSTIIGIQSKSLGVDTRGLWIEVIKRMSSDLPRRIASIEVDLWFPGPIAPEERSVIEKAARDCPVHHSLHPGISVTLRFHWR